MVDLISDEGRRALAYLDMVERQGARPTVAQLDTYADLTRPRWVPSDWADDGDVSRNIEWSRYMQLVEWIEVDGNLAPELAHDDELRNVAPVSLTALGRAVLAGTQSEDSGIAAQVLLGEENPLAYGIVMASLARLGSGLLIDPYLTDTVLLDLLKVTSVDRILTSTRGSKGHERAAALAALGLTNGLRIVSVTTSDALHDRFFMSDGGAVVGLGASLNGLEKNVTTLAPIAGEAAVVLRNHFESVWASGTNVVGSRTTGAAPQGSVDPSGL